MSFIKKVVILISISLLAFGCTTLKKNPPGAKSQKVVETAKGPVALYYDFDDVLIPGELKPVKKNSSVVQTPGFTSGVLDFKGKIDRDSLINFFSVNMGKDNWRYVSLFKSPQSTIMLFSKENRWCVMTFNEQGFYTEVEIGVAPSLADMTPEVLK